MTTKVTIFLISMFLGTVLSSQQYYDATDSLVNHEDIIDLLPPLSTLLDSAETNSPMLKFYDADIIISELKVKLEKRDWMNHLGVEAGVKYGLLDNVVFSSYFGSNMNNFNSETRYSIGVYLRIPIRSVLDKTARKQSEQEIVKSRQLHERTLNELRQLVIMQFNNLVKAHRSLIIRARHVATYETQMLRAERDFLEGNIPVAEYARLNDMHTTAMINLESNKVEFNTALQLLQETVGIKIDLNL